MSNEFYEKYRQKGGTYVIPVEIFDELLEENEELKKKLEERPKEYVFIGNAQNKTRDFINQITKDNKKILEENKQLKKKLEEYKQEYEEELEENSKLSELWCDSRGKIRELEEQLEDMTDCRDIASGHRKEVQDRETILLKQQQEFIKYLEDEIKGYEAISDLLFNHNKELKVYKEILQKYKSIIGVKDEKDND